MTQTATVVVMTRDPVPGRVKTRLIPSLGPQGAAHLHAALVAHTAACCQQSGLPVRVALEGDLAGPLADQFRAAGFQVQAQGDGDLGQRLAAALAGLSRTVCIGTDCPELRPDDLRAAAGAVGELVLGPALDGGYWLIAQDGAPEGLSAPGMALFADMPWSTDRVLGRTLQRAAALGLPIRLLPWRSDLDTIEDLRQLARLPELSPLLGPFLPD